MKKARWISIRQTKIHELRHTLRHIRASEERWVDVYNRLSELEIESIKRIAKQISFIFLIYLLFRSFGSGSTASIMLGGNEVIVPISFLTFAASANVLILTMTIQNSISIVIAKNRVLSDFDLSRFSVSALSFYNGYNDYFLSTPIGLGILYRFKYNIHSILSTLILIFVLTAFSPVIWIGYEVAQSQYMFILYGGHFFEKMLSLFGIFNIITSVIYIIIFNIPLPVNKNLKIIRWGLLSRLAPKGGHSRAATWLNLE